MRALWAVVFLLIVSVVFALPTQLDGGYEGHESHEGYKRHEFLEQATPIMCYAMSSCFRETPIWILRSVHDGRHVRSIHDGWIRQMGMGPLAVEAIP
ncbi:unnamed protein product [Haemonchus placei]|uniref:Secreted protein n=1 Tax=Haemonchus placei TaxID=6290 RepID=A0A0N4WSW2_HAEPC|nr:unnamed protein product [Haemonchus placei]